MVFWDQDDDRPEEPIEESRLDLNEIALKQLKDETIKTEKLHESFRKPPSGFATTAFQDETLSLSNNEAETIDLREHKLIIHQQNVIQRDPIYVCAGKLHGTIDVTVRKLNRRELDKERQGIVYHEHILANKFDVSYQNYYFIIMEHYDMSLDKYNRQLNGQLNVQVAIRQISDGIKFLHGSKIVHNNLIPKNIAVKIVGESPVYKIMNLSSSIIPSTPHDEELEIRAFGGIIEFLQEPNNNMSNMLLKRNLINKIADSSNGYHSIDKVRAHPYFYDAAKTMNFIITVNSEMEYDNDFKQHLENRLGMSMGNIDWRTKVSGGFIRELKTVIHNFLERTERKNQTTEVKRRRIEEIAVHKSYSSLLKHIRNLVSFLNT